MKDAFKLACIGALMFATIQSAGAQSPNARAWGLYASYEGLDGAWKDPVDPCSITYTVGRMADESIAHSVDAGLMVPIMTGVTRAEAQAGLRLHDAQFDDAPDSIVKMAPCHAE